MKQFCAICCIGIFAFLHISLAEARQQQDKITEYISTDNHSSESQAKTINNTYNYRKRIHLGIGANWINTMAYVKGLDINATCPNCYIQGNGEYVNFSVGAKLYENKMFFFDVDVFFLLNPHLSWNIVPQVYLGPQYAGLTWSFQQLITFRMKWGLNFNEFWSSYISFGVGGSYSMISFEIDNETSARVNPVKEVWDQNFTVGLGIEYRFNDYLGLLLEYQYLINQFGDHGTGSTSLPGIGYRSNIVNNGVNILSLVFKIYF